MKDKLRKIGISVTQTNRLEFDIMIMPIFAVADVAASLKFYVDKLEFHAMLQMPGENGPSFAMVSLGEGTMIGLSRQDAPEPKGQGCVMMVYVAEGTDIDAYCERARAAGAAITRELADEYWGDRTFMTVDPDGFHLQLCKTIRQVTAEEVIASANAG